jgi:flagellar biosynthesis chaperone FliJ
MDLQQLLAQVADSMRANASALDEYRLSLTSSGGSGPVVQVQQDQALVGQVNQLATALNKANETIATLTQQLNDERAKNLQAA